MISPTISLNDKPNISMKRKDAIHTIVLNDIKNTPIKSHISYIGVKNEYIIKKLHSLGFQVDQIEGNPEKLESCPCCGYNTLSERGVYDICPVCFWEDDGVDNDFKYSGPNHMTLSEGRSNFRKVGACDEEAKKHIDPDGVSKYSRNCT